MSTGGMQHLDRLADWYKAHTKRKASPQRILSLSKILIENNLQLGEVTLVENYDRDWGNRAPQRWKLGATEGVFFWIVKGDA